MFIVTFLQFVSYIVTIILNGGGKTGQLLTNSQTVETSSHQGKCLEISMLNVGARVLTHVNVVILVVRSPLPPRPLGKWPEFSKIVGSDLEIFLTILMSN